MVFTFKHQPRFGNEANRGFDFRYSTRKASRIRRKVGNLSVELNVNEVF